MNPNVEVYVATHKPIDFALPDYCKKIQVNAEANGQWPGYLHDNDGSDNISLKNPNYCELTALYSMWKNCKADIQGLYHYRRLFTNKEEVVSVLPDEITKFAVSRSEIISVLKDYDIIVTSPLLYDRIMTIGEMFRAACYWKDIRELYRVIEEKYPDYLPSLEYAFSQNHYYSCNVFISNRKFVNEYCTWLFDVLGEVEKRISLEGYDTQHKRIYGYFSEHLLNVYIHRHNLKVKTLGRVWVLFESRLRTMLKKIPPLVVIVRLFRNYLKRDITEKKETERFYVSVIRHGEYDKYYITEFTPKNPDNFIHDLESVLPEFESQAKSEGMGFVPRVILSSETPESVRKSLFDLGVRVIHR